MKYFFKLTIYFALFLYFFCQNEYHEKHIKKNRKTRKDKKPKVKRRIEGDDDNSEDDDDDQYHTFGKLNIYLDTNNLNETFPYDKEKYLVIFINAMNKAKDIIESFIEIEIDTEAKLLDFNIDSLKDENIMKWNKDLFGEGGTNIKPDIYNYFIFFKFDSINIDAKSLISYTYLNYDTPIIGIITFSNTIEESKLYLDYLTNLILHQFIHLLGFHIKDDEFYESCIIDSEEETVDGTKRDYYYIDKDKSPGVFNYLYQYFNCDEEDVIDKIKFEIDEYDNPHWPKRYFLGDIMTEFDYPEEQVISGFTLAFLNDLEYINVLQNYNGGLMKFGKFKGCDFLTKGCGEDIGENKITFSNEFFVSTNPSATFEPSCSSGRLSKTVYKLYSEATEPDGNQYYQNGWTGPKSTNYCPIAEYNELDTEYIYKGHCYSVKTSQDADLEEKIGETFSPTSFCVLSSLVKPNSAVSEMRSVCYEMKCSPKSLTIKILEYYLVCPREGGQIKAKGFNGYLLCPDYYLICGGTTLCNNLIDCATKNSSETEESLDYEYTIITTQNSSVYSKENPEIKYGYELTDNGVCPRLCMQCTSKENCIRCYPHYIFENNECIYAIPNCIDFQDDDTDICTQCDENFLLAEDSNGNRFCLNSAEESHYYHFSSGGLEIYKKCEDTISQCSTCSYDESKVKKVKCTSCNNPYKLIDDGEDCGDINSKLFYEDTTDTFISCTNHPTVHNCYKCEKSGDTFTCLECKTDYVLYYNTPQPICIDKNLLDGTIYSTDDKNYYPCNNSLYNDIPYCSECSGKETCSKCKTDHTIANGNSICIPTSDITALKYYQDPDNNYYYECSHSLEHCFTCYNKNKCKECITSYVIEESDTCISYSLYTNKLYYLDITTNKYFSCSKISNCEKCTLSTDCIECKEGFNFIKGNDNNLICENIDTNKYYQVTEDGKTYYKKCEDKITNCDECSSENYCTKCKDNFGIIETDHTKCESLSDEKYYYDTTLEQFKLCSNKIANCEKCSTYGDIVCKKCFGDFVLKHESNNIIQCEQKTFFDDKKTYFKDEEEKNYYLCSFYNDISSCAECTVKEICDKCNNGYDLENNQALCASKVDKENNIYIYNPQGLLVTCSSLYQDCNRCNDTHKCIECQEGAGLIDNNTCLSKATIEEEHHYFKDEITNKYISCSVMDHCITCSSSTICTSCQTGFKINNNNLCEKINESNDDSKGLGTGAIIGIVIGCIAFLVLIALLVYYLYNKFFKKSNGENFNMNTIGDKVDKVDIAIEKKEKAEDDPIKEEKIEQNEPVAHTTKRSIHNH